MTEKEFKDQNSEIIESVKKQLPDGFLLVGIVQAKGDHIHSFTASSGKSVHIKTEILKSCQESPALANIVKSVAMEMAMDDMKNLFGKMDTLRKNAKIQDECGTKMGEA